MYLDTSYIAKFYLNESESSRVRELVRTADIIYSSMWALVEFHCVIHRHLREGSLASGDAHELSSLFYQHVQEGLWKLLPVHEALLRRISALMVSAPPSIFLRTADAVHLATAHETGEREVWTGDRHMLLSAAYFGLTGRSV